MRYKLEMKGIDKSFAGMQALCGASLTLREGEARALLGINGAGKSTMIKILSGVYTRDAGEILIDGQPCQIHSPKDALACGISAVSPFPNGHCLCLPPGTFEARASIWNDCLDYRVSLCICKAKFSLESKNIFPCFCAECIRRRFFLSEIIFGI